MLCNFFCIVTVFFFQDKLRGSKHIGAVLESNAAVFCSGRKAGLGYSFLSGTFYEVFFYSGHGDIIFSHGSGKISDHSAERIHCVGIVFICLDHALHFHGILRDRSGLINAEHIYPCQRLDAFHIMKQDFLLRKPYRADCKRHTGQQIQAFRDHTDYGSDHGCHAVSEPVIL